MVNFTIANEEGRIIGTLTLDSDQILGVNRDTSQVLTRIGAFRTTKEETSRLAYESERTLTVKFPIETILLEGD